MKIKPIRTNADHLEALREIERLWNARPGTAEHDKLEVLGTLVEVYERAHVPIPPPDPVEAILFRMEQQALTRKDLLRYIGTRARVSEILARKRNLTLGIIRALHEGLGIPLDVLAAAPSRANRSRGRTKSLGSLRRSSAKAA